MADRQSVLSFCNVFYNEHADLIICCVAQVFLLQIFDQTVELCLTNNNYYFTFLNFWFDFLCPETVRTPYIYTFHVLKENTTIISSMFHVIRIQMDFLFSFFLLQINFLVLMYLFCGKTPFSLFLLYEWLYRIPVIYLNLNIYI